MTLKPCLDCGTLSPGARCPAHRAATDNARYARRGKTAERGLSGLHARISRQFRDLNLPCVICGRLGTPDNPITAGHIIARSKGGPNVPENYQPECRSCGSSKQNN